LKVIWAILCQNSAVDRDTNNLSLFNVVEELTVPARPPAGSPGQQLPAGALQQPLFQLVVLWTRSDPDVPEQGRGRIQVLLPDGSLAMRQEFEVVLTQYLRVRFRSNIPELPVGGEGVYRFLIDGKAADSEWSQLFELPLSVVFQRQDSG
jgi:hypothetical protein